MPRRRKWPVVLAGLAIAAAVLIVVWDWNWFRPWAERQASAALGRQVSIGRLELHLLHPQLVLDDLAIANPPGFPAGSRMATVGRLALRLDPAGLFHHQVRLVEIDLDHTTADLEKLPSGAANWKLQTSGSKSASHWQVIPGLLLIDDGHVRFVDPTLKSDFELGIHTGKQVQGREPDIVVDIDGRYSGQPIQGRFVGGSVLSLRDPNDRYPVDLDLHHGATRVQILGTLTDPMKLAGADVKMELSGDDLASLYPLTGIPLAPTPPYRIGGQLDYANQRVRFRDFAGTVGNSDLEGELEEEPRQGRPYITADLSSRRVVLADLAGFIGGAPGREGSKTEAPKQKAAHARQEASGKVLPDKPINLPKLRSADVDVHYKAEHIQSQSAPLDNVVADLKIENGDLILHPLSFAIGQGKIVLNIRLSGQQDLVHAVADIDFRQVDLSRIMQSTGVFKGAGTIGGKAEIDTTGNSLASMLGHGNGELKLFMSGGDLSAVLVDLAGLDLGKGVISALGLPDQTQLRCMASDFQLTRGTLQSKVMILDTAEANVVGDGELDLGAEQIDYRLSTQPKHFSVGRIRAPIEIEGPLKNPKIMPQPGPLAARGGAAAVLGALLTPLAALVPTIQLGLGKDHNCGELIQSVRNMNNQAPPPK